MKSMNQLLRMWADGEEAAVAADLLTATPRRLPALCVLFAGRLTHRWGLAEAIRLASIVDAEVERAGRAGTIEAPKRRSTW